CQWLAKQRYRRPHAMELPALNGLSCPLTINTLLVGMAETESQAAHATEHVQRPFQSAPAFWGFVTVIRILGA
ncbi:hypothetical protein, partial [Mesorhizobium sp. M0767]|uniref:hypothetical protein n=1 Tax=Mesorhizobium sp. M0767 TaxID=2956995 RepID=UPI003334EE84